MHFRRLLAALRDYGVNALLTESDSYDEAAISAAHEVGFRFYAGIACFSDHATNFRKVVERPDLWPVLETGERRPQMEWYVGITPTDRGHQREILSTIRSVAATYPIDGLFLDFVRWPLHWEIELRPNHPRPPDSSFDTGTLAIFEHSTGVRLPPDTVPTEGSCGLDSGAASSGMGGVQVQGCKRICCRGACDLEGRKAERGVGPFHRSRRRWSDGGADRPAPARSRTLGRFGRSDALPQHPSPTLELDRRSACSRSCGWRARRRCRFCRSNSNRDPGLAADWGPPMSVEDWRATLAEVAGRTDLAGLVAFPGGSLVGNGRGELLREVVG